MAAVGTGRCRVRCLLQPGRNCRTMHGSRSVPGGFGGGFGSGPKINGRKNHAPSRLLLLSMVVFTPTTPRISSLTLYLNSSLSASPVTALLFRRSWMLSLPRVLLCAVRCALGIPAAAMHMPTGTVHPLAHRAFAWSKSSRRSATRPSVCLRSLPSRLARPDPAAGMIDAISYLQLDGWLAGQAVADDGDGFELSRAELDTAGPG
ncbi:uncharacterized protein J3D65DRAFT_423388 [Phyllosticta citribraziliensis]|uniref:Uncharacterized protein n=1 Tax=Phyllosticta citribraziliensis TaxID=989973 RepID=A0ABR1LHT3_9PEZI